MATYKQGILGGFSGKIGNVIGTFWKGQNVMRVVPASVTVSNTPAQLEVRMKFSVLQNFISSMKGMFSFGFGAYDSTMTTRNAAFKYNYDALKGTYPDISVDLTKVILSRGNRAQLYDAAVHSTVAGTLDITWAVNSDEDNYLSDSVMAAVIEATTGEVISCPNVARRMDETASITLPAGYSGKSVTVYVFAVSDDGLSTVSNLSQVSDSQNLGSVTVA